MPKKGTHIRFSDGTKAKLNWLAERYGTQTEAVAVAIELLYGRDYSAKAPRGEEVEMRNIWIEEHNELVIWRGPGWYASRQEGAHENQHTRTYQVGTDPEECPDTYTLGLGTPQWLDGAFGEEPEAD
jgi:hypothetical protein